MNWNGKCHANTLLSAQFYQDAVTDFESIIEGANAREAAPADTLAKRILVTGESQSSELSFNRWWVHDVRSNTRSFWRERERDHFPMDRSHTGPGHPFRTPSIHTHTHLHSPTHSHHTLPNTHTLTPHLNTLPHPSLSHSHFITFPHLQNLTPSHPPHSRPQLLHTHRSTQQFH